MRTFKPGCWVRSGLLASLEATELLNLATVTSDAARSARCVYARGSAEQQEAAWEMFLDLLELDTEVRIQLAQILAQGNPATEMLISMARKNDPYWSAGKVG